jgi:hypothetical protein
MLISLDNARRVAVDRANPSLPHARASCSGKNGRWGYVVEVPSSKVLSELEPKKLRDDWGEYLGPRIVTKSLR